MKRSIGLLFVLLLAISTQAQVLSDQITVNVVEVPVYVTRYNGEPVRGLTKDDFELFVNGRPHPIDYFDTVVPSAQKDEPIDLHRRRLFVLLFDDLGSSFIAIHRAKIAAEKFVDEAPAGDVFAVAVTTRRGIVFAVPFTTDRVAVRRAIATLRESAAGDAFSLATLESERARWDRTTMSASERAPSGGEGPWDPPGVQASYSFTTPPAEAALQQARMTHEEWMSVQRDRATRQLAVLADRLAPISGIKHVVLLHEAQALDGYEHRYELTNMHRKFRDAGVILNAIDIGGLRAPWSSSDSGLLADPNASLYELALETGGTVAPTLESLRRTQSVTYIVGFVPPEDGKRKWNSIAVRVRNKPFGAYVNHRRGYSLAPGENVDESLFLADVMLNDIPLNGISVDLDIERDRNAATLVAKVPGIELLSVGSNGATTLDVFLYVFDENDVVASWTQMRLNVDHAKGRTFLEENPYTIRQQFRLGPGRYSAKALLQIVGTEIKGFERTLFEIPKT